MQTTAQGCVTTALCGFVIIKKRLGNALCRSGKQLALCPARLFGGGAKGAAAAPYGKGEIFVVVVRRICYNNHKSMQLAARCFVFDKMGRPAAAMRWGEAAL